MTDTSATRVEAATAPPGPEGQVSLASGRALSMRLWEGEAGGTEREPVRRDYETVGSVSAGRAELELEGRRLTLEPGSSWVVPKGASHTDRIPEQFHRHGSHDAAGRDPRQGRRLSRGHRRTGGGQP